MKYAVTGRKIAHIIRDDVNNGWCGFWYTACGKWIRPTEALDAIPDGARMCAHCNKKMEVR